MPWERMDAKPVSGKISGKKQHSTWFIRVVWMLFGQGMTMTLLFHAELKENTSQERHLGNWGLLRMATQQGVRCVQTPHNHTQSLRSPNYLQGIRSYLSPSINHIKPESLTAKPPSALLTADKFSPVMYLSGHKVAPTSQCPGAPTSAPHYLILSLPPPASSTCSWERGWSLGPFLGWLRWFLGIPPKHLVLPAWTPACGALRGSWNF